MKGEPRRSVCLLLPLAAAALAACNAGDEPRRPNLLLLTLDTLRADHLGCYGYALPTTPFLDELAGRAVVFERAVSTSAVTPVSHASILTGLYPQHHGLRSLHGGVGYELPPERRTLAELLQGAGYATGGFVSAFPVTRHYGLDQGFERWDEEFEHGEGLVTEAGIVNTGGAQRRADRTVDRALEWIEGRGERPFFAWVHLFDVHDGVVRPPAEYARRFPPADDELVAELRALYDAELAFVDAQIARLVGALERSGALDDTVIAVVADHGQGLGDHGWWGHCILYEEQVRVPMILALPGRREGVRVSELVRSVDLLPTLTECLGLELPPGLALDGRSLGALLAGGPDAPRLAYSESLNDLRGYAPAPIAGESLHALQDGPWKLIAYREGGAYKRLQLFHLERDPGELENLAAQEEARTRAMLARLEEMGVMVDAVPEVQMDEETRRRLQSLGYAK